jgi:hypothetical protein
LENGFQIGQNSNLGDPETLKINTLAEAAGVDIAAPDPTQNCRRPQEIAEANVLLM